MKDLSRLRILAVDVLQAMVTDDSNLCPVTVSQLVADCSVVIRERILPRKRHRSLTNSGSWMFLICHRKA